MCIRHTWGLDVVGLPRPSSFGLKVLSVERNMAEASICQEVRSRTLTSSETAQRAPSWHRCVHLRHCPVPSISCAASTLHPHAHTRMCTPQLHVGTVPHHSSQHGPVPVTTSSLIHACGLTPSILFHSTSASPLPTHKLPTSYQPTTPPRDSATFTASLRTGTESFL